MRFIVAFPLIVEGLVRRHPHRYTASPGRPNKGCQISASSLSRRAATAVAAGEIMRALIERIVLTPVGNALRAELYGDFASIAALSEGVASQTKTKIPAPRWGRDYCGWLRGEDLNL